MNIWFTSDHHFGHDRIIGHCQRPFTNVEEMDAEMVHRWNQLVAPRDTVYHLGDIIFRRAAHRTSRYVSILRSLNGNIHLILGNHDCQLTSEQKCRFASMQDMLTIHPFKQHKIILCHYAMRVWNCSHHNSWHLYGHSHGNLSGQGLSMDVGVDTHGFEPYHYDQIVSIMDHRQSMGITPPSNCPAMASNSPVQLV